MSHGIRHLSYAVPAVAIREILANSVIHQDLTDMQSGTLVEIFSDRVVITNPGKPLIPPDRFVDSPSKSRNPELSDILRRLGLCEERGSGIDRALNAIEQAGLPPIQIRSDEYSTSVTIFGSRKFPKMSSKERAWACYWHACLCVERGVLMTNRSLRAIRDAIERGMVRPLSEDQANRNARYVPYWH